MVADAAMRASVQQYSAALKAFTSSTQTFRILSTPSHPAPRTLYVLDSSFNPPTRAHLKIAVSALLRNEEAPSSSKRLLLLLATQNADKAPQKAPYEQRLHMMQLFASDLLSELRHMEGQTNTKSIEDIGIDIGVTTLPYFVDKAQAISSSGEYGSEVVPQVHLTGFDTLLRVLDPKYYPPKHTLEPLEPFFATHRFRVTYRTDDQWGSREKQDQYLKDLGDGKRRAEGAKEDWATDSRIRLVEGREEGEEIISSTRARKAAKDGDEDLVSKLVTESVAQWVLSECLYK